MSSKVPPVETTRLFVTGKNAITDEELYANVP